MIKKYSSDKTIVANYSKLSFTRIFHSGAAYRMALQSKRITYERIYDAGGPLSKSKTWYDLLSFNINGGYNHDFKRISLNSYLGTGIMYLLAKSDVNTSMSGTPYPPNHYNFDPKDTRCTIPVSFSLGMDYRINHLLSISLNSGMDYNLIPFTLRKDGVSDFGYISHSIYQYSLNVCLGITFKI
jgi:hypothetical protein